MSERVLKRQLRELLEGDAVGKATKAKRSRKQRRRKRERASVAQREDAGRAERKVVETNLAYFNQTKGTAEEIQSVRVFAAREDRHCPRVWNEDLLRSLCLFRSEGMGKWGGVQRVVGSWR